MVLNVEVCLLEVLLLLGIMAIFPENMVLRSVTAYSFNQGIIPRFRTGVVLLAVGMSEERSELSEELVDDLRCFADAQFAWGVNRVVWHGKPFSTEKDPKKFYASVHLGDDGKLAEGLESFNRYLEKVSDYMSRGETYSRLAVYFSLEDQWMRDKLPEELRKPSSNFYWELQEVHMDEALLKDRRLRFFKEWL